MIRIIIPGKLPRDRLMGGACQKCGCVVECTKESVFTGEDRNEIYHHIICPTCQNPYLYVRYLKRRNNYGPDQDPR